MKVDPPRVQEAQELLQEADTRLEEARDYLLGKSLMGKGVDYESAAHLLVEASQTSLQAFMTWHGMDWPDNATLLDEARRAVSLASILRTPLRRVRQLAEIVEPIRGSQQLSVKEREAVETGFYAVRNLHFAVIGELPPAVRPASKLAPNSNLRAIGGPVTPPVS